MRALVTVLAVALNVTLFTVAFKVLAACPVTIRQIRGGAVAAAVTWQALHLAGALLLGHKIKGAIDTYGLFALVPGLRIVRGDLVPDSSMPLTEVAA